MATVERRELRLARPLNTGAGAISARTVFLVRIESDGVVGVGEAAPLPWAGTETVEQCAAALQMFVETSVGDGLPPNVLRAVTRGCPAAVHGWEQARADWTARRNGVRLAELWASAPAASVAVNALVDGVAGAVAAVEAGFRTLKLKATSVDLAAAVRAAVGDVRLRIDANGAWGDEAEEMLTALAPLGLEYVEQPFLAGSPEADARRFAELRGCGVPLAADESVTGVAAAEVLAPHVDVLVLKPMRLRGFEGARAIAGIAREQDADVVVTGFLGSAVERAGALHLAAALDSLVPEARRRAHGLGAGAWLAEDVADLERIEGGRVALSETPGHGVVPR